MSHELYYTSAPSGLKPGSKGFCTVACTEGIPAQLMERLESLSGYRYLFEPGGPQSSQNPVSWAHWRVTLQGRVRSVLSRVCEAGSDYTGRSNKFAHHVSLELNELPGCGPAYLMLNGFLEKKWSGAPRTIPVGRAAPDRKRAGGICEKWQTVTGDAGWAGVLAASFISDPSKPAYIIYGPSVDILGLFEEALALLPDSIRWQVTFNTYFTDLPAGLGCAWRGVVIDSAAAREAIKQRGRALVIDLAHAGACGTLSPLVDFARTGIQPAPREMAKEPGRGLLELEESAPARRSRSLNEVTEEIQLANSPSGSYPNVVIVEREVSAEYSGRKHGIAPWIFAVGVASAALLFLGIGIFVGVFIESHTPTKSSNVPRNPNVLGQMSSDTTPLPVSRPAPTPSANPSIAPPNNAPSARIASADTEPDISDRKATSRPDQAGANTAPATRPRLTLAINTTKDTDVPIPDFSGARNTLEFSLAGVRRPDESGLQIFSIPPEGKGIPELKFRFVWDRPRIRISVPKAGESDGMPVASMAYADTDKKLKLVWVDQSPENDAIRRQCALILSSGSLKIVDGDGKSAQIEVFFSLPSPGTADSTLVVSPGVNEYKGTSIDLDIPINGLRCQIANDTGLVPCQWFDEPARYSASTGSVGFFRGVLSSPGPEKTEEIKCSHLTQAIDISLGKHQYYVDLVLIPNKTGDGCKIQAYCNTETALDYRRRLQESLAKIEINIGALDQQKIWAKQAVDNAIGDVKDAKLKTRSKIREAVESNKGPLDDPNIKASYEAILREEKVEQEGNQLPNFKKKVENCISEMNLSIEQMATMKQFEIGYGNSVRVRRIKVQVPSNGDR